MLISSCCHTVRLEHPQAGHKAMSIKVLLFWYSLMVTSCVGGWPYVPCHKWRSVTLERSESASEWEIVSSPKFVTISHQRPLHVGRHYPATYRHDAKRLYACSNLNKGLQQSVNFFFGHMCFAEVNNGANKAGSWLGFRTEKDVTQFLRNTTHFI
jgi:hypothetical protein